MESNEIYHYEITVEGYKTCKISVRYMDRITYLCLFRNVDFINEFGSFGFLVATSKYGDPTYKNYGEIPEKFMEKAWAQIFERLDTPDWSEKVID
jgi:hypothetical protein